MTIPQLVIGQRAPLWHASSHESIRTATHCGPKPQNERTSCCLRPKTEQQSHDATSTMQQSIDPVHGNWVGGINVSSTFPTSLPKLHSSVSGQSRPSMNSYQEQGDRWSVVTALISLLATWRSGGFIHSGSRGFSTRRVCGWGELPANMTSLASEAIITEQKEKQDYKICKQKQQ